MHQMSKYQNSGTDGLVICSVVLHNFHKCECNNESEAGCFNIFACSKLVLHYCKTSKNSK